MKWWLPDLDFMIRFTGKPTTSGCMVKIFHDERIFCFASYWLVWISINPKTVCTRLSCKYWSECPYSSKQAILICFISTTINTGLSNFLLLTRSNKINVIVNSDKSSASMMGWPELLIIDNQDINQTHHQLQIDTETMSFQETKIKHLFHTH